jgi:hypothetical protein
MSAGVEGTKQFGGTKTNKRRNEKMKAITEILDQVVESFTGKRGKIEQNILVLVDREPTGRLRNTFDYVMSEDEIKKHTGKLTGKKCELAVTDIQPAFGGRLRMRGQILSLP